MNPLALYLSAAMHADPLDHLILSRSLPEPTTGCRLWLECVGHGGYGIVRAGRAKFRAHRVAWELQRGPIPEGLCVCHRCDTPACVNVEHLFLGTHADNARDRNAKGRCGVRGGVRLHPERAATGFARGDRHGSRVRPESVRRGAESAWARLSENDVAEARARHGAGESGRALAATFGVSQSTMSRALSGRTWRHVGGAS